MSRERTFKAVLPGEFHGTCVYCGDTAGVRDHFRPWIKFREPYWLPACQSCNSILWARATRTFEQRVILVEASLLNRYQSVLECNYESVKRGLKGSLLRRIVGHQAKSELIRMRLLWMSKVRSGKSIVLEKLLPDSNESRLLIRAIEFASGNADMEWRSASERLE